MTFCVCCNRVCCRRIHRGRRWVRMKSFCVYISDVVGLIVEYARCYDTAKPEFCVRDPRIYTLHLMQTFSTKR